MNTSVITHTGAPAVKVGRQARPRLRRILFISGGVVVALLVVGYFGVSAYIADKLSRPARNPPTHTPAEYGLEYEDVEFNSTVDNIPLSGWYIDSPGDKVIVMMHGRDFSREANGGLEKAAVLAGHNYDVFMFDFRAHGLSGGERYAMGAWETRDVAGALNYLKSRGVTEVGSYGISLGAATQIMAAVEHPEMKAIVSEAAYADLPTLLENNLPKASGLPSLFNPGILFMVRFVYGMDVYQARPTTAVRDLGDRPVLLIHSVEDAFVPVSDAYQLQQAGADNPNLTSWIVPTGEHCEVFSLHREEYTERMLQFYDKYLK